MTREERKRALALEKVIGIYYSKWLTTSAIMKVMILVLIFMDTAMIIAFWMINEIFNVSMAIFADSWLLAIFLLVGSDSSQIGDNASSMTLYDNANPALGGSMFTGKFLCALPYKSKDILNLRLINFEKELAAFTLLTVAVQIAILIAGSAGLDTYGGVIGAAVLISFIIQTIALVIKLSRIKQGLYLIVGTLCGACGVFIGGFIPDSAEEAAEMESTLSFLSVFSGVSGIVIVIVFAVVLAAAGEFYLKRKNNVSWNLY